MKEVNYINTPNTSTLPNPYFSHCTSLKNITFNFDIEIPEDAFYNCTSLEGIEVNGIIGGGQIGNYAFQNCTSLKSFDTDKLEDYGSYRTAIGEYAFANCTSLTEITIPDQTAIGFFAFGGCTNLKKITFTGTKNEIEAAAIGFDLKEPYDPDNEYSDPYEIVVHSAWVAYTSHPEKGLVKIDGVTIYTTGKLSDAHTYAKDNDITEVIE